MFPMHSIVKSSPPSVISVKTYGVKSTKVRKSLYIRHCDRQTLSKSWEYQFSVAGLCSVSRWAVSCSVQCGVKSQVSLGMNRLEK